MTTTAPTAAATADRRPLLDQARAAIPDHDRLVDLAAELDDRIRRARASAPPTDHDLIGEVAASVVDGGDPVPADLGARVVAAARRRTEHVAAIAALTRLRDHARMRLAEVRRDGADVALDTLRAELAEIVAAARPLVEQLDSIPNADAAIASGAAPEWGTLVELARQYRHVRSAQLVVVADVLVPADVARPGGGGVPAHVRQLVDVHGTIANARDRIDVDHIKRGPSDLRRDATVVEHPPWSTADPIHDLRYVCRPEAQPWVPTVAELLGERDRRPELAAEPPATAPTGRAHRPTSPLDRGSVSRARDRAAEQSSEITS